EPVEVQVGHEAPPPRKPWNNRADEVHDTKGNRQAGYAIGEEQGQPDDRKAKTEHQLLCAGPTKLHPRPKRNLVEQIWLLESKEQCHGESKSGIRSPPPRNAAQ